MFEGCKSLTSLNISGFDTSQVTDMHFMFSDCHSLASLDLSHFDTATVTDMRYMFRNCSSLTSLDVFANQNTFTAIKGSSSTNDGYTAVSSKLSRIRLHKGNGNGDSSKLCAFVQQNENNTADGYTGNWTAFSEYNHANGSELTPDINNKYSSLQNAYNSITDEQWAANPDGIWFVWEKPTELKVNAVVCGNMGSRDKEFTFTTQFPSSLHGKTLTTEKSNGTTGTITIDNSGMASFTLKHGESITFKNLTDEQANAIKALPDLGIKEQDYSSEGYSTTYSVSSETDGALAVSCRNTKQSTVLTGNHIGTGITAIVLIGIAGLVIMLRKKRK